MLLDKSDKRIGKQVTETDLQKNQMEKEDLAPEEDNNNADVSVAPPAALDLPDRKRLSEELKNAKVRNFSQNIC